MKKRVIPCLDREVLRVARALRFPRRGFGVVERVWARSDLDPDGAMKLAVSELHAMRAERRAARRS